MNGTIPPLTMCSWHAEGQLDLLFLLKLRKNRKSLNLEPSVVSKFG